MAWRDYEELTLPTEESKSPEKKAQETQGSNPAVGTVQSAPKQTFLTNDRGDFDKENDIFLSRRKVASVCGIM
ncbi:unnamed protein product [Protopolystoma xenopodis]|uniref:Uncharacterized protein n=1 Tax=Protopolystoma xenopodis TaxID=117903 RepID=A0A3S5FBQ5_9PLAT|nr:unnamed protein product [Protopolystoma xenopodis]